MKQLLLFILCLSFSISAIAQDGSLDLTFNPFDIGKGDGPNDYIRATTLQNDGKIIISGDFTSYNGILINGIARLNTDGSLDTTFNVGTGVNNGGIHVVAIQADGKVIIGGWFSSINGILVNRIARLNTDGSLDTTFNVGTGANSEIEEITIQADGKIIIGGSFTSYNGISINRIARLNTDGSLDTTFNVGTGVNNSVRSIAIQADGKVIIGGFFTSYNDISSNYFVRINADGSLDTSFNIGTGLNDGISEIVFQDNGKVIIGGYFTNYNGISVNRIARLNTDGSLDTIFNIGSGVNASVNSIIMQDDGNIFINGYFTNYNGVSVNNFIRLNTDGSLDSSFNASNEVISGEASIAIQNDGKVIFGGYVVASSFSRYLTRLNTDGNLDVSFNVGYGANSFISDIAIEEDGKVIISGAFTNYNNMTSNNIARLNTDGSLDPSFNVDTVTLGNINNIAIQEDGKVIISGYFLNSNYFYTDYLTRLNADGSLDTSFNVGTGATNSIDDIVIQEDGKIIITGFFDGFNGVSMNGIARLNADGSLDTSFDIGTGASGRIFSIGMQDDGKIIIGGYFSDFNGTSTNDLARLNTDGSLDTSFNVGSFSVGPGPNNAIRELSIQEDGKVIISGFFTGYNGVSTNDLARLYTDGSLDTSFNAGSGVFGVREIGIQNDGKIIIGGDFTSYNGTSINRIARLNTDGSLDTNFNIGTGANNSVIALRIQDDEQVVAAGSFTSYNGTRKNRIIRINSSNGLHINDIKIDYFNIHPNPAQNVVNIKLRQEIDLKRVTIYNNLGQQVLASNKSIINTSNLASGLYLVEVETNKGKSAKKLIVE
ncbi:T9SS type A sorting domain-containing protein [Winogradskyella thalassocola]|nr:T9SS type A sorting domain-containing protein [Winogradskyella thalassocola]